MNTLPSILRRRTGLRRRSLGQRGQTLTEFTLVLVMMIGIALALVFFLSVFTEQGWRVLQLISLENP